MRYALAALFLLGCGARPDAHFTPLIDAARGGDTVAVRSLLAQGADPNEPAGNNDWTPLLHAIHKHQTGSVQALIAGGADINRIAGGGETPLMMAAGYGYTDIVELLLKNGADARVADSDGLHAIDLAAAGVPDIDRFTLFQCHDDTIAALRSAAPAVQLNSKVAKWPRAERCKL